MRMLIFTYKLERYIKNKILPKILVVPDRDKYQIKGSFRRRIPYITDIDIVNNVHPEYDDTNIYQRIIDLISSFTNDSQIKLIYVICGTDDRFLLTEYSDEEIEKIKVLLNPTELVEFDNILSKYQDDPNKKLFYINEIIWDLYKLRWTLSEVLAGKKILRGGIEVFFQDVVKNNSILLLQYFVKIEYYPIGFDIAVRYKPINLITAYQNAAYYQLKLANYSKEYYFMLFPLRFYFKNDPTISKQLEYIIETKFGLYKQLLVRIDSYRTIYESGSLDLDTAKSIIISIIKDIRKLNGIDMNIIDKIQEVSNNSAGQDKIIAWNTLLYQLYTNINKSVNKQSKKYFIRYINIIPKEDRKLCCLEEEHTLQSGGINFESTNFLTKKKLIY
ncbi:hypothetical protein [Niemeyer virus]|nr:hypothetical protein [Niemeyer virus]